MTGAWRYAAKDNDGRLGNVSISPQCPSPSAPDQPCASRGARNGWMPGWRGPGLLGPIRPLHSTAPRRSPAESARRGRRWGRSSTLPSVGCTSHTTPGTDRGLSSPSQGAVPVRPRLSRDSRPSHAAVPTLHAATRTGTRSTHGFFPFLLPNTQRRWYGWGRGADGVAQVSGPVPASRQSRQRATGLLAFEFAPWAPSGWTVPNVGVRFSCLGAVPPPRVHRPSTIPLSVQPVRHPSRLQRLTSDESGSTVPCRSPVRNNYLALQK